MSDLDKARLDWLCSDYCDGTQGAAFIAGAKWMAEQASIQLDTQYAINNDSTLETLLFAKIVSVRAVIAETLGDYDERGI